MVFYISRKLTKNLSYSVLAFSLRRNSNGPSIQEIRVRFAPSPTGSMHLGGLRTALYNYIFARKHGGKFLLRIEDTDQTRIVPDSAREIEELLRWAGLEPDESPTIGGSFGPYVQSERLHLYQDKVNELLERKLAYRCFCSPTRLQLLRKHQLNNRQKPQYDRRCKHLKSDELKEKLNESGGRYAIRFDLQPGALVFEDMIYGKISTDLVASLESDPVIMKSDGMPTYHFANVVDDHLMKISHVMRGSEWIPSTAKHLQIYNSFGWEHPKFAHFPLITLRDGSKMSKRNNESQLRYYIDRGYHPITILNFILNMGGGVPKYKQDSHEVWDLNRIVQEFNFNFMARHAGSADIHRLNLYSIAHITKLWSNDKKQVLSDFYQLLSDRGISSDLDENQLTTILDLFIGTRITTLNDLLVPDNAYIWRKPILTWDKEKYVNKGWKLEPIVRGLIEIVKESDVVDKTALKTKLEDLARKYEVERPAIMMFIRNLLTNSEHGQPVLEIFECLGKTRLLKYLESGLDYVIVDDKARC